MPRVVVPIYFDYASTLCYIPWRIVRELEAEPEFAPLQTLWKGVPIASRDFSTRPGHTLAMRERNKVIAVAAEPGIAVMPPATWLDSGPALQGAELAREAGVFAAWHEAVFRAAFEERVDIGDMSVLTAVAAQAGIDPARFSDDIRSNRMAAKIAEHKQEADNFSALGYPTFMLGDFPSIGIQPIETMRLLIGRFIAQRIAEPQA